MGATEGRPVVGVIGAMDVEVELLRERMEGLRLERAGRLEVACGTLGGVECRVMRSGVGKVAAAMAAELLVVGHGATHLVNTGVAGAIDPSLGIGDMVVSTDCVHHDVDAGAIGYPPGQLPELEVLSFPADGELASLAAAACAEVAPEARCVRGRVASGDQFVGDGAAHERVRAQFGAACCEMEGAPIAQVAWTNEVPFVVVRSISDGADDGSAVDYPTFERMAARRCAAIVERILARLGEAS